MKRALALAALLWVGCGSDVETNTPLACGRHDKACCGATSDDTHDGGPGECGPGLVCEWEGSPNAAGRWECNPDIPSGE